MLLTIMLQSLYQGPLSAWTRITTMERICTGNKGIGKGMNSRHPGLLTLFIFIFSVFFFFFFIILYFQFVQVPTVVTMPIIIGSLTIFV